TAPAIQPLLWMKSHASAEARSADSRTLTAPSRVTARRMVRMPELLSRRYCARARRTVGGEAMICDPALTRTRGLSIVGVFIIDMLPNAHVDVSLVWLLRHAP